MQGLAEYFGHFLGGQIAKLIERGQDFFMRAIDRTAHQGKASDGSYSLRFPEGSEQSEQAEDALIDLIMNPDSLIWFNISEADFASGKSLINFLQGVLGEVEMSY